VFQYNKQSKKNRNPDGNGPGNAGGKNPEPVKNPGKKKDLRYYAWEKIEEGEKFRPGEKRLKKRTTEPIRGIQKGEQTKRIIHKEVSKPAEKAKSKTGTRLGIMRRGKKRATSKEGGPPPSRKPTFHLIRIRRENSTGSPSISLRIRVGEGGAGCRDEVHPV